MAKDAVIFTTTFYNTSEEGLLRKNLALDFARRVVESDYPLVVLDGGTDEGRFIEQLNSIGARAYSETQKGLGPSRREALGYAYQFAVDNHVSYLSWSEPEKVDYVRSVDHLVEKMKETGVDLIVPHRKSMRSYPLAQWHSETFGNQLHADAGEFDMNGTPLDQFFGPHMWRRQMSPYFQVFDDPKIAEVLAEIRIAEAEKKYKTVLNVDIQNFERIKAQKDLLGSDHMMHMPTSLMVLRGQKVLSVQVDYDYPTTQAEIETRNQAVWNGKRLMQLNALAEQFKLVRVLHERRVLEDRLKEELEKAA